LDWGVNFTPLVANASNSGSALLMTGVMEDVLGSSLVGAGSAAADPNAEL
jgi:hypothetical protein